MKRITCLFILALLFAFLLLPPFLRRFANFDLEKVSTKGSNDKVVVLSCQRKEEKLNTSYLNDKTYNIQYKIPGDYTKEVEEENNFIVDFKTVAKIKYDSKKNMTIYKIDVTNNIKNNYLLSINEQQKYYETLGFSCTAIS